MKQNSYISKWLKMRQFVENFDNKDIVSLQIYSKDSSWSIDHIAFEWIVEQTIVNI